MKLSLLQATPISIAELMRQTFAPKASVDVAIWILATPLAMLLRYDGSLPAGAWYDLIGLTLTLTMFKFIAAHYFKLHRRSWAKMSFADLGNLVAAMGSVTVVATIGLFVLGPALGIPRTVGLIDGILTIAMMGCARTVRRHVHEQKLLSRRRPGRQKNALIVGAGEAGSLLARELLRHPDVGLRPVGFLDDNRKKLSQRYAGIPVLGTVDELADVVASTSVDEVLIAIPSAEGDQIRSIVNHINETQLGLKYRIVPGVYELLSGKIHMSRMRDVRIDDLLRRKPVRLDTNSILGYLEDKTVMITGAGGSIGSELVRQICAFRPRRLILYGHGENSIYQLERELEANWPEIDYRSVIGAVQISSRLKHVFETFQPNVVFHSAAHKHVPLMELNPEEAVFNNVIASRNLVRLALEYGVSHFVNISTDKAVRPTSVMGASKRMVEYIVQDAASKATDGQVFVSVRFGNVLGSRGSVIPIFKQQIENGGPVTVTHPDVTRYFMTIPEAAQLVLQASGQGRNGEIYILDMGQPVKIVDLARDLIALSGYRPETDIAIRFTGMRPGEKMFEELMTGEEEAAATSHSNILVSRKGRLDGGVLEAAIIDLRKAALLSDHTAIRSVFERIVDGCSLDQDGASRGSPDDRHIAA